MPGQTIIDDGSGSSSGPYFNLLLNPFQQNIQWDGVSAQPILNAFNLSYALSQVSNPSISFHINFDNGQLGWLSLQGNSVVGNSISMSGGSPVPLVPVLGNIANIPNGTYTAEIIFSSYGVANGQITNFDTSSFVVTLNIYNNASASISVDKSVYNVVFNRQTGLLSGDTVVTIINNNNPDNLDFSAKYFVAQNNVTTSFNLVENAMASNPAIQQAGLYQVLGVLEKVATGYPIVSFEINLTVVENDDLHASVDEIDFILKKSIPGTQSKSLYLTNVAGKTFTITAPSWLLVTPSGGSSSGYINLTTVNSTAIAGGVYSGVITITYDTNKLLLIPVSLSVIAFVNFNPPNGDLFCLDIPKVTFNRVSSEARFIKLTLNCNFSVNGISKGTENTFQIPYLEDFGEFSLGQKVQAYFPKSEAVFMEMTNTQVFMQPASVQFTVEELDVNFETLLSESVSGIMLYPGKKPKAYPLLSSFLHRKKNGNSIFINSEIKNSQVELTVIPDVSGIDSLPFGSSEAKYYELPQNYFPVHVQFLNQNLAPEWFTFTGDFKISSEFDHIYAKDIFRNQNKKYDFSKAQTLFVNTGFILKSEEDLIEEIIESPIVFIKIEDKLYRCFSTTKKLDKRKSADRLVSKDLEFLIVEENGN